MMLPRESAYGSLKQIKQGAFSLSQFCFRILTSLLLTASISFATLSANAFSDFVCGTQVTGALVTDTGRMNCGGGKSQDFTSAGDNIICTYQANCLANSQDVRDLIEMKSVGSGGKSFRDMSDDEIGQTMVKIANDINSPIASFMQREAANYVIQNQVSAIVQCVGTKTNGCPAVNACINSRGPSSYSFGTRMSDMSGQSLQGTQLTRPKDSDLPLPGKGSQ